jgi:acyl-CoA thioester hydrolase
VSKPTSATRGDYRRFITLTTRWMDNDVYRHVNNVVYYSFFDTAVNQYMLEQGVLDFDNSPTVSLVVETGCQYFSPIAFPDIVHCGLRVAHLGSSSVRYEIGIFRNDEVQVVAQGYFVHVAVDRHSHRPRPMPDNLRRALAALQ